MSGHVSSIQFLLVCVWGNTYIHQSLYTDIFHHDYCIFGHHEVVCCVFSLIQGKQFRLMIIQDFYILGSLCPLLIRWYICGKIYPMVHWGFVL